MVSIHPPHLARPRSAPVMAITLVMAAVGLFLCFKAMRGMSSIGAVSLELNLHKNCQAELTTLYRHAVERAPAKAVNDATRRLDTCKESLLQRHAPAGLEAQKDETRRKPLKLFLDNLYQLSQTASGQTAPPGGKPPAASERDKQVNLLGYYINTQEGLAELEFQSRKHLSKMVWAPFQLFTGLMMLLVAAGLWVYAAVHQHLPKVKRLAHFFSLSGGVWLAALGLLALSAVWTLGSVQRPSLDLYGNDWELARLLDGVKNATLDFEAAASDSLGAPAGSDKEKRYELALNTFVKSVDKFKSALPETEEDKALLGQLEEAHHQFAAFLIGAKQLAGQTPPRLKEANEKLQEARESPWRADLLQMPGRLYASRNRDYQEVREAIHRKSMLFSIFAFLIVILSGGATFFGRRLVLERVIHPLKEMEGAAAELRLGHFDHPVVHPYDDELGQLGRTLEALRQELGARLSQGGDPVMHSLSSLLGEESTAEQRETLVQQLALEQVDEGVVLFSPEGMATYANQAALRLLGFNTVQELSRLATDLFDEATARVVLDYADSAGATGSLDLHDVAFGQDQMLSLHLSRLTGPGAGGWLLRAKDHSQTNRLAGEIQHLTSAFGPIRTQWETLGAFLGNLPAQGGLKDRWRLAPTSAKADWSAFYLLEPGQSQMVLAGRSATCPALMEQWPENTPGPFGLSGRLDQPPVIVDLEEAQALACLSFGDKKLASGLLLVAAPKDSPLFSPALLSVLAEEAALSTLATLVERQRLWEDQRQSDFQQSEQAQMELTLNESLSIRMNPAAAALLDLKEIRPATLAELAAALNWPEEQLAPLKEGEEATLPRLGEQALGARLLASLPNPATPGEIQRLWRLAVVEEIPQAHPAEISPPTETATPESAQVVETAPPEVSPEQPAPVAELPPPPEPPAPPHETVVAEAAVMPPPETEPEPEPETAPPTETEEALPPEPEPPAGTPVNNIISAAYDHGGFLAAERGVLLFPQGADLLCGAPAETLTQVLEKLLKVVVEQSHKGAMVRLEATAQQPWVKLAVVTDTPMISPTDAANLNRHFRDNAPPSRLPAFQHLLEIHHQGTATGGTLFCETTGRGETALVFFVPQQGETPTAENRLSLFETAQPEPGPTPASTPAPAAAAPVHPPAPARLQRLVHVQFEGLSSQRMERFLRDREFSVTGQSGESCPTDALCQLLCLNIEDLFSQSATPPLTLAEAESPCLFVPGLGNGNFAALPLPPVWEVPETPGHDHRLQKIASRLYQPGETNTVLLLDPDRHRRETRAALWKSMGFQVMEADSSRKAQLMAEAAAPTVLDGMAALGEGDNLLVLELLKHQGSLGAYPLVLNRLIPQEFSRRERLKLALGRFVERHPLPFKEMAGQVHGHLLKLARVLPKS